MRMESFIVVVFALLRTRSKWLGKELLCDDGRIKLRCSTFILLYQYLLYSLWSVLGMAHPSTWTLQNKLSSALTWSYSGQTSCETRLLLCRNMRPTVWSLVRIDYVTSGNCTRQTLHGPAEAVIENDARVLAYWPEVLVRLASWDWVRSTQASHIL